jgi:hypothetical protein
MIVAVHVPPVQLERPLTHPIVSAGSPGMRKRGCRCSAPWADDSSDDNDDDSRASRHHHLHADRTRIVPGRTIGLCLRIRRLGVRISSGAQILTVPVIACFSLCRQPACNHSTKTPPPLNPDPQTASVKATVVGVLRHAIRMSCYQTLSPLPVEMAPGDFSGAVFMPLANGVVNVGPAYRLIPDPSRRLSESAAALAPGGLAGAG